MSTHVNQGVLRQSGVAPAPFPIFNGLPHYQNGTIPIGSEFVDVLLDIPVQDTALTLVILNASSCWVAPQYAVELVVNARIAPGDFAIEGTDAELQAEVATISGNVTLGGAITGELNGLNLSSTLAASNPNEIPLTNGSANGSMSPDVAADSQSTGAWYDWVDETTIRIHRGGGECVDCYDNCVIFSVQILEFLPGMFQSPA